MNQKIRFVVLDGNILGCVYPQQPLSLQILASSVVRGAKYTWHDGCCPLPLDPAWVPASRPLALDGSQPVQLDPKCVRPATRADFDAFGFSYKAYEADPAYDFPAA